MAEIGRICKHVDGKTADGVPSAENERKIGKFPPKISVLSCRVGGEGPLGLAMVQLPLNEEAVAAKFWQQRKFTY